MRYAIRACDWPASHLGKKRQELPASLGKITILAVAVTKNGRKHGDPTEQLDRQRLGNPHKIEFGETSRSRSGRLLSSLCVLRASVASIAGVRGIETPIHREGRV
jgi:hypothetical protein